MDYTGIESWIDEKKAEVEARRKMVSGKFTWSTDARRIRALKIASYEAGMTASQYLAMALDAYLDERSDAPGAECRKVIPDFPPEDFSLS